MGCGVCRKWMWPGSISTPRRAASRCKAHASVPVGPRSHNAEPPEVPLAVTSTTGWIKRLGRNWARLHMLVYPVAVLAVLHFWWLVKSDLREPALYAAIAALLLGWRIWKRRGKSRTSPSARA